MKSPFNGTPASGTARTSAKELVRKYDATMIAWNTAINLRKPKCEIAKRYDEYKKAKTAMWAALNMLMGNKD